MNLQYANDLRKQPYVNQTLVVLKQGINSARKYNTDRSRYWKGKHREREREKEKERGESKKIYIYIKI